MGMWKSRSSWPAFSHSKCHTAWPLELDWCSTPVAPVIIWGFTKPQHHEATESSPSILFLHPGFQIGLWAWSLPSLWFHPASPKDQVALVNVFREHKIASAQLSALADKVLEQKFGASQACGHWLSKGHLCQPRNALSRQSYEMSSDNQGGVWEEHQYWDTMMAWP